MTYLLDTNTCIYFLNERSEALTRRIKTTHPREIVVCSVVKHVESSINEEVVSVVS